MEKVLIKIHSAEKINPNARLQNFFRSTGRA